MSYNENYFWGILHNPKKMIFSYFYLFFPRELETGLTGADTDTRLWAKLKKHDVSSRVAVSPYRIRRLGGSKPYRATMIHCLNREWPNPKPWTPLSQFWIQSNLVNDQASVRNKPHDSWEPPRDMFQVLLGRILASLVKRRQFC